MPHDDFSRRRDPGERGGTWEEGWGRRSSEGSRGPEAWHGAHRDREESDPDRWYGEEYRGGGSRDYGEFSGRSSYGGPDDFGRHRDRIGASPYVGGYAGDFMIGGSAGEYAGGFGGQLVNLPRWPGLDARPSPERPGTIGGSGYTGGYAGGAGEYDYRGGYTGTGGGYGTRGLHAGRGPRSYRRSDDRIEDDVNEQLTRDPYINAEDIEVKVKNGEVKLSGKVDSRHEKRLAEDIAESCFGATDVRNEIKISRKARSESVADREVRQPVAREQHGREDREGRTRGDESEGKRRNLGASGRSSR